MSFCGINYVNILCIIHIIPKITTLGDNRLLKLNKE